MRPRVFPAEDEVYGICYWITIDASMRPRVFPAEDTIAGGSDISSDSLLQ